MSLDAAKEMTVRVWAKSGDGSERLHGDLRDAGYRLERHEFITDRELDWSPSFHSDSLEICVNLQGRGRVRAEDAQLDLAPLTSGFYLQGSEHSRLLGARTAGERHEFITFGFSYRFLRRHLSASDAALHPRVKDLLHGSSDAGVSESINLTPEVGRLAASLRQPPVPLAGQPLWYQAKALEMAAALFYPTKVGAEGEFFCQRQKRLNHERVQRVITVLRENIAQPPTLEEIGRRVGCSHFYLSRIFTQETGKPIFQYLRELRLERAAELLRAGRLNVTQVAMEVGYSSPSHFSAAFHAMFGCCPGLYPYAPVALTQGRKRSR